MNNNLLKGLAVLELLSRSPRPLGLTQIGRELGMAKSNVHRLMQALIDTRFVLRDEEGGNYSPSIKLWELGSAVLARLDVRRHAQRHMHELMELTGESVHLSVLDGIDVVYLHRVDSAQSGAGRDADGWPGAVVLCRHGQGAARLRPGACPRVSVCRPESHTAHTITDRSEFLKEMQKVRRRGYATNRAEWREGVWGMAAPILDARGFVIAAVGVCGPASGFRRSVMPAWGGGIDGHGTRHLGCAGQLSPSRPLRRHSPGTHEAPTRNCYPSRPIEADASRQFGGSRAGSITPPGRTGPASRHCRRTMAEWIHPASSSSTATWPWRG
jgi:DNA-binding IclR family transcriptional regulator